MADERRRFRVTDTTYATFWRRLARWLVDDVPDKVMLTMTQDRVDPGQPMKLTAEVLDGQYQRHQRRARRRTSHLAIGQDLGRRRSNGPSSTTANTDRASCRTRKVFHTIRLTATRDVKRSGIGHRVRSRRPPPTASTSTRAMRAPLLKRIAEETGGRFYTEADVRVAA